MKVYYIGNSNNRSQVLQDVMSMHTDETCFVSPAIQPTLPIVKLRIREMISCDLVITSGDFYEDTNAVTDLEIARHMGMNVQSIIRFKNDIKGNNRKG